MTSDIRPIPWWVWLALMLTGAAWIAACQSTGSISIRDGEIVIKQPSDAVSPATFGPAGASTGARQEQSPAMIAAGKAWISYVVGGAMMLAGVGLLVAKKWMPLLPTSAGTYTMLAGGAVIAVAMAGLSLASVPWWAWGIVAGAGAAIVVPGWLANRKQVKSTAGHPAESEQ